MLIDADAHVTEPVDIWTARVPERFHDQVPRVDVHPRTNDRQWRIGDTWYWPVAGGLVTQAGWPEYPPSTPREYDEVDPAAFDPRHRLTRMDEYGIDIQILYPNLIGFVAAKLMTLPPEVALLCARVYNDFILEWCSVDPRRLVPMAMLPFWDVDASVEEMERCVGDGFRGVVFANKFERIGLPHFTDRHWDRIYAAAQDLDIPVNFHVGFGDLDEGLAHEDAAASVDPDARRVELAQYLANQALVQPGLVVAPLLVSGLCERFPRLRLMNVELGFGHLPYFLENLDWHWKAYGNARRLPLLPSEYFRRQCYGTLWFEQTALGLLEQYPENFLFSTDFPHSTSLTPGPASAIGDQTPSEYIADSHGRLAPDIRAGLQYGNAARLYRLDLTSFAAGTVGAPVRR